MQRLLMRRSFMRIGEWFTSSRVLHDEHHKIQNARRDITMPFNESTRDLIASKSYTRDTYPAPIIKISLYVGDCAIMQIIVRIRIRLSAPVVVAVGLQADYCIIMQIASLVNTKNVRTTPPADNQPIVLSLQLTRPPWPHRSRFSSRCGTAYTCAIDATRGLKGPCRTWRVDRAAPVLSTAVYVTPCTESVLRDAAVFRCRRWSWHSTSLLRVWYCSEENKMPRQLHFSLYHPTIAFKDVAQKSPRSACR